MAKNEKAAFPWIRRKSGSGEQCVQADIRISEKECTTPTPKTQCIADLLLCGEENAIPLQHLASMTGLDPREIRRMIHAERLHGTPILANNRSGNFLPSYSFERARCVSSMRHRAGEIERAADAIERSGRQEGGKGCNAKTEAAGVV